MTNFSAMIELIALAKDRFSGSLQSFSYLLESTMILATKSNRTPRHFVRKFWLRNKLFLLDDSIKKDNFFARVHHIIRTYGGPKLRVFLP